MDTADLPVDSLRMFLGTLIIIIIIIVVIYFIRSIV